LKAAVAIWRVSAIVAERKKRNDAIGEQMEIFNSGPIRPGRKLRNYCRIDHNMGHSNGFEGLTDSVIVPKPGEIETDLLGRIYINEFSFEIVTVGSGLKRSQDRDFGVRRCVLINVLPGIYIW
jgi:hypothetical protein